MLVTPKDAQQQKNDDNCWIYSHKEHLSLRPGLRQQGETGQSHEHILWLPVLKHTRLVFNPLPHNHDKLLSRHLEKHPINKYTQQSFGFGPRGCSARSMAERRGRAERQEWWMERRGKETQLRGEAGGVVEVWTRWCNWCVDSFRHIFHVLSVAEGRAASRNDPWEKHLVWTRCCVCVCERACINIYINQNKLILPVDKMNVYPLHLLTAPHPHKAGWAQ